MPLIIALPELLKLLSTVFDVPRNRLTAMRGRLQIFQKEGFPPGTRTGRGRPARYGPRQIVLLSVAFGLLQQGVTPKRAAAIVRISFDEVERAISRYYAERSTILLACSVKELVGAPRGEQAFVFELDLSNPQCLASDMRLLVSRHGAVLVNLSFVLERLEELLGQEAAALRETYLLRNGGAPAEP